MIVLLRTIDDQALTVVFDAIAEVVQDRSKNTNPQDITNTVWTFAQAGHALTMLSHE